MVPLAAPFEAQNESFGLVLMTLAGLKLDAIGADCVKGRRRKCPENRDDDGLGGKDIQLSTV